MMTFTLHLKEGQGFTVNNRKIWSVQDMAELFAEVYMRGYSQLQHAEKLGCLAFINKTFDLGIDIKARRISILPEDDFKQAFMSGFTRAYKNYNIEGQNNLTTFIKLWKESFSLWGSPKDLQESTSITLNMHQKNFRWNCKINGDKKFNTSDLKVRNFQIKDMLLSELFVDTEPNIVRINH